MPNKKIDRPKTDLMLPFVISTCLVFPTLLVFALIKQSVASRTIMEAGTYSILYAAIWPLVGVAVISGCYFAARSRSGWTRATALTVVGLLILVSAFIVTS